jgi:4a-hydroxytetrahydrobiopterin dehydratase
MIIDLKQKHCVPCEGGLPPMTREQIEKYSKETPEWQVADDKKITRSFKFKDFAESMVFVNKVASIANEENHHPDIYIFYNLVRLELMTHAVNGLFENDFILAAKIDEIVR